MKKIFLRILKWTGIFLLTLILVAVISGLLFLNISPQFGGSRTAIQQAMYAKTGHFVEGKFTNAEEIVMVIDCHSIKKMMKEMFEPNPNLSPRKNIEVIKLDPAALLEKPDSLYRVTWFGHSTFLVEWEGKTILLDPIFGQYAAPHRWFGRARYNKEMPINIEDLPAIDAVIISHDHYDHLDYPSIKKLKDKVGHFFVPLGVANHLRRWKIPEDRIHEMDWWQENKLGDITLAFTPSRHMSGRSLNDQSNSLWGSWVLMGKDKKLFFSGDGGYGKHFKAIGEKYGPFDLGLMECGQYNKLWADVHMMPEQTVQAGIDVGAEWILPIHWGSFTLSTHSWTDPAERVTAEAKKRNLPITTPQIGESVVLGNGAYPKRRWWEMF